MELLVLCLLSEIIFASPTQPHQTLSSANKDTLAQQQPGGHDHFVHGLVNIFPHELLYVENDMVLHWQPATAEWALLQVYRQCGVNCPLLGEQPINSGQWPQLRYHKLTFLGCHPTTGHGHVLEVDPSSGNYSIYMFQHYQPDPMTVRLAHHQRLEMTEYAVTYVGKDEVVLYDPNIRNYHIYLVEPKLPMLDDEDPIGPFDPIDSGNFSLFEQLIYLGHDHLFTYSSTTGQYSVLQYDRTATVSDIPFSHIAVDGYIDKLLQLTYLGDAQMLAYSGQNGHYKGFVLSSNWSVVPTHTKESVYIGFGSLLVGDFCIAESTCMGCIAKDGCGWCLTSDVCLRGSVGGPCTTNCTSWELTLCPGEPCNTHIGCAQCLSDPFCGWCSDSNSCTEGTLLGPLFGSCAYSKVSCPMYSHQQLPGGCSEEIS